MNGGTPSYAYLWTPGGATTNSATGLTAGTYSVTVTDANNCTSSVSVNVTQPTALTQTTSTVSATCGSANGSASVVVSGGSSPYSYAWSPGGATGSTASALLAGNYQVQYTDAHGCTGTAAVTVGN